MKLYSQLKDKEFQISKLNAEINNLKLDQERLTHEKRSHHTISVSNALQRIEREKDCAATQKDALKLEICALNEKIRVKSSLLMIFLTLFNRLFNFQIMNDCKLQDARKIMELEEKIVQLQCENNDLEFSKVR